MRRKAPAGLLVLLLAAALLPATGLLPARVEEASRLVEAVRGRRFETPVAAAEMGTAELKRVLRAKLMEGFPASPEETLRCLVALGLVDEAPALVDRLVDFYVSQVIAFYDPEPRKFFLVRGAGPDFEGEMAGMAESMILSHELTHALQDQTLRLDRRLKDLKDNTDGTLALECLLEGEATLVMVRVALSELPGADEEVEEAIAPLLSAGALERANVPKDVPEYFVDQLFFPYVEGTAYVRRAIKKGGWKEVDRLWANPPLTTSEIMHEGRTAPPVTELLPAKPTALAPPQFRFLFADTLGEWTTRYLLRRTVPAQEADAAAEGWRGDRIAFFVSGNRTAFLWRLRLASPEAASRFESVWKKSRRTSREPEFVTRRGSDVLISSGYAKPPVI